MVKLTRAELKFVKEMREQTISLMGPKRNPTGPDRATIRPEDAQGVLRVNRFMRRSFLMIARKRTGADRDVFRFRAQMVGKVSKRIREKLTGDKPISQLIVTGTDAIFYFAALELTHRNFAAAAKNYVEASPDHKRAEIEAKEVLWAIRSLIQVGHMPAEKSRFLR